MQTCVARKVGLEGRDREDSMRKSLRIRERARLYPLYVPDRAAVVVDAQ